MSETQHKLEQKLIDLIRSAKVTHVRDISPDTELDALGLDSLAAMILIEKMEAELDLSIDPTELWEHHTVSALAAHLIDRGVSLESPVGTREEPKSA